MITQLSDTVDISGQINLASKHLGQQTQIVVSITYQSFDAAKNEQPIDLTPDAHGQISP